VERKPSTCRSLEHAGALRLRPAESGARQPRAGEAGILQVDRYAE